MIFLSETLSHHCKWFLLGRRRRDHKRGLLWPSERITVLEDSPRGRVRGVFKAPTRPAVVPGALAIIMPVGHVRLQGATVLGWLPSLTQGSTSEKGTRGKVSEPRGL